MPLLDYSKCRQGRGGRNRLGRGIGAWLAVLVLVQSSACAKAEQRHDESQASVRETVRCPQYESSTRDWHTTPTADGSLVLLLPPDYQIVQTDSGQMWASQVASISYRRGAEQTPDTTSANPEAHLCSESLGDGARLRYYHARAATGEGHYLQAYFKLANGTALRLIGFSQDSADGTVLLAIARAARVSTR